MCQVKPKITVIVALAVVISGQFSPLPRVVVPSRDVFQSTLLLCARLRSTSESDYNYYDIRSSRKKKDGTGCGFGFISFFLFLYIFFIYF